VRRSSRPSRTAALREAAYRVLAAFAHGAAPSARDLTTLRDAHRGALAHATLTPTGARPRLALDRTRGPRVAAVARGPVDFRLLRSQRPGRLKQCANCRWLKLDSSRNFSRR
jgi:predicted RNA-binding Zn ribbon-like protein